MAPLLEVLLACAAAHAVLDVIEQENLIARSKELGNRFKDSLIKFARISRIISSKLGAED